MKLQSKLSVSILTLALSLITSTAFTMEKAEEAHNAGALRVASNDEIDPLDVGDFFFEDSNGVPAQVIKSSVISDSDEDNPNLPDLDMGDFFLENSDDEEGFDWNPIRAAKNGLYGVLSVNGSEKGIVTGAKKAVASKGANFAVKSACSLVPGGDVAYNVAHFYSSTEKDKPRGEGTLGRTVGHKVKTAVEWVPGGAVVTDMAQRLKPAGADTLTEGLITAIAGPRVASVKGPEDAVGAAAASVVGSIPLVGGAITGFTGFLGKSLFGTETLTAGVLGASKKVLWGKAKSNPEAVSSADEASPSDDEKSEEA